MYKVIKGWPSNGALDLNLTPASGVTITAGQAACIDNTGKLIAGTYNANGSDIADIPVFCIDTDPMGGGVVALLTGFVLEVDSDHYDSDSYTALQSVTISAGKFTAITNAERAVAKVLSFNATTGKMVLAWFGIENQVVA